MASVRGILNIQSLNELTYENNSYELTEISYVNFSEWVLRLLASGGSGDTTVKPRGAVC
jgi:hypothetical protein